MLIKFLKENGFLLKLAIVTAIGWWGGFYIILLGLFGAGLRTMLDSDVGVPIVETVQVHLLAGAIVGGMAGLLAGSMNWFILRRRLNGAGKWVATSTLGWAIAWAIIFGWRAYQSGLYEDFLIDTGPAVTENVFIFVLGGIIIGTAQWLVLRRQISDAIEWISTNAILLPLAMIIEWLLSDEAVTIPIEAVLGGFIAGIIAGATLAWLLQRKNPRFNSFATK